MYIRATATISPQLSFEQICSTINEPNGNRFVCAEPDYSTVVDARMIRRMSRIIKMGVAAAKNCLQQAALEMPDAIITGTAYGCLADTEVFLGRMIEFNEELLTPTAFIQSTHNTVGAQIALLLQCHNYNNTFVHRGFSFESSLLDAFTLIHEQAASTVLVGAVDEITNSSHHILERFGLYKNATTGNLYSTTARGTLNGEGAAFFVLSDQPTANDYASLDGLQTVYKPANTSELPMHLRAFLNQHNTRVEDIDLVLCGDSGDPESDTVYNNLRATVLAGINFGRFKHLCGDYPTATGFALWLAASILKVGRVPETVTREQMQHSPRKILVYNHYQQIHHSLYLLSAC